MIRKVWNRRKNQKKKREIESKTSLSLTGHGVGEGLFFFLIAKQPGMNALQRRSDDRYTVLQSAHSSGITTIKSKLSFKQENRWLCLIDKEVIQVLPHHTSRWFLLSSGASGSGLGVAGPSTSTGGATSSGAAAAARFNPSAAAAAISSMAAAGGAEAAAFGHAFGSFSGEF